MRIRYMIGPKCNFHCKYCIITKGTKKFIETDNDNVLYEAINECNKYNKKVDRILITGGEPTLYKERVFQILKNLSNVNEIMIHTNLTDVETVVEFCKFDNVKISFSYDGEVSDRDFSIFDNILKLIKYIPMYKIIINYVVTPTSYLNIVDTMKRLEGVKKGLSLKVEHSLIQAPGSLYEEFNIDKLKQELENLFIISPFSPIFTKRAKNCHYMKNNDYIEIQNGKVYYGCCEGIAFYDVITDKERFFYCKQPDICMTCDNEYCNACGLKFDKLSGGLKRNEPNFFCTYYGIIRDICNKYSDYLDFIYNHVTNNLLYEFNFSWNCNLRCSYCFEEKDSYIISYETIDRIFGVIQMNDNNPINIEIFGGEPLMNNHNLERLDYIVDRLLDIKSNRPININITTNCTNYNRRIKDIFNKILKYNINLSLQVSLDGYKEIHDINRCNSFDKTYENMISIKKDFKNITLNTNTVINVRNNCGNLLKTGELLQMLKDNNIVNSSTVRFNYDDLNIDDIDFNSYYKNVENLIYAYKKGKISEDILKVCMQFSDSILIDRKGCGVCYNMLTFDPYGNIIPCHRCNNITMGNINNLSSFKDYNNMKKLFSKELKFRGYNDKLCDECKYNNMCVKCKNANLNIYGDLSKIPDYLCKLVHINGNLLVSNNIKFQKNIIEAREDLLKIKDIKAIYDEYQNILKSNNLDEDTYKTIQIEIEKLLKDIKFE